MQDGAPVVVFDAPEEGVSPGQACVLYDAATGARPGRRVHRGDDGGALVRALAGKGGAQREHRGDVRSQPPVSGIVVKMT